ncbi:MAG: RcnB family protein [Azoarcus sp.]|jgi:Ni/Co efflux regulator RcnB|nr:RcnB family protein [Azoarcus sp.]
MKHPKTLRVLLAALLAGAFASAPVLAAPPDHDRDGRAPRPAQRHADAPRRHAEKAPERRAREAPGRRAEARPRRVERRPPPPPVAHFEHRHRDVAHDYFRRTFAKGRCPPGLSRRGQHCVPTHHVRAWKRGAVLPRTITYYDVPSALLIELPPPPHGHRYVRVAGDILLLAIGTGLVIDAIQDIFD